MKTTKRVLAILACVCMLVAMIALPAAAASDGTITITAASDSNAVIGGKKFNAFKIFEATKSGSTTAYEWYKPNGENIYYDFFFGTDGVTGMEEGTIVDVVNYILGLKDNSFEFSNMASKLHEYIHDKNISYTAQKDLTGDLDADEARFEGLDYGYYMIYDSSDLGEGAVRSAAMLTNVTPDAEVVLKAYRPTVEKYVDDDPTEGESWKKGTTSGIGETDTFKIVTAVPNHDLYGDTYVLTIADEMDEHLIIDQTSVKVYITEDGVKRAMTLTTEYSVEFPTAGKYDLVVDFKTIPDLKYGSIIEVYYNTTLAKSIDQLHTNEVTMTFSNDPTKDTTSTAKDSALVHSYVHVITKRAETAEGLATATALAGAQFKVYAAGETEALIFEKVAYNGFTAYVYAPDKTAADLATDTNLTDVVDTINDGEGVAPGVKSYGGNLGEITLIGLAEGAYEFEEIKAPDGYQLPEGKFTFSFTDEVGPAGTLTEIVTTKGDAFKNGGQISGVSVYTEDLLVELSITNRPGNTLPETGGMGTTVFTIGGILLMAAAVAFFTLRKRNNLA